MDATTRYDGPSCLCSSQTAVPEMTEEDPAVIPCSRYPGTSGSGAISHGTCLTEPSLEVPYSHPAATKLSSHPPSVKSCLQHPKGTIPLGFTEPRHDCALATLLQKCFPVCLDLKPFNEIDKTAIGAETNFMGSVS